MKTTNKAGPFVPGSLAAMLAAAAGCLVTGLSDPADQVAKTSASKPQEDAQTTAKAKEHIIRVESKIESVGPEVAGSFSGGFEKFSGKISVANGEIAVDKVIIDLDSTWTDTDRLTEHLRSPGFFDVANRPTASLALASLVASNAQHIVTGNLDLCGVNKSITFPAEVEVAVDAVTAKSEFAIDRKDFNITYPCKPNDLIRDNVVLKLARKATPGEPRSENRQSNKPPVGLEAFRESPL